MKEACLALILLLCASACDSNEGECVECGQPDGSTRDQHGGDRDPCEGGPIDAGVVGWEDETAVGSAADAFGPAEGSCDAELRWNGAAFDDRIIEPRSGDSPVTVELTLDHETARWIERTAREGSLATCDSYLEVQGHVSIETDDGTLRAESDVALQRSSSDGFVTYRFEQSVAEHEGSLMIELHEGEQGTLSYELDGSGACAGAARLSVSSSRNGMGVGGGGQLAEWSDSVCPLGQAELDLTEPGDDGTSLGELIEGTFGDGTYAGTWSDGEDAELALHVELVDDVACRDLDGSRVVTVPVRATYSTSDGRLRERAVDASVRATLGMTGAVRQLDFWLSDDLVCEDEDDTLDYEPADCAEVESVTVQLGFNDYRDGEPPQVNDEGLNVYFSPRGGGEPPVGDRLRL